MALAWLSFGCGALVSACHEPTDLESDLSSGDLADISVAAPGPCSATSTTAGMDAPDYSIDYEYDLFGRAVTEAVDHGADGTYELVLWREWTDAGQLAAERQDTNGDGLADYDHRRYYDLAGYLVGERLDDDGDGEPDLLRIHVNDLLGRPQKTVETDAQGNWLGTVKQDYDLRGNLIAYEISDWSKPLGVVLATYYHEYGPYGRLRRTVWDGGFATTGADGRADGEHRYTYDAKGSLASDEEREYGSRRERLTWTRDRHGLVDSETWEDLRGDRPRSVTRWYRDSAARLVTIATDDGDDGVDDERVHWTYDLRGNPTTQSTDHDADGTPETVLHYDYSCF